MAMHYNSREGGTEESKRAICEPDGEERDRSGGEVG